MNAIIVTQAGHWQLTNKGGNSTSTSIVKPKSMVTTPANGAVAGANGLVSNGDGVIEFGGQGSEAASAIVLQFFGVGADTTTGLASVYGWNQSPIGGAGIGQKLWVPMLLASFSFELDSNMPGIANTLVPATDPVASAANYWATTITLVTGNSGISCEVVSPGHANDMAHVVLSSKGCKYIEVRYGLNSSSTSLNGTWKYM